MRSANLDGRRRTDVHGGGTPCKPLTTIGGLRTEDVVEDREAE
jgi:hypothetical protein